MLPPLARDTSTAPASIASVNDAALAALRPSSILGERTCPQLTWPERMFGAARMEIGQAVADAMALHARKAALRREREAQRQAQLEAQRQAQLEAQRQAQLEAQAPRVGRAGAAAVSAEGHRGKKQHRRRRKA